MGFSRNLDLDNPANGTMNSINAQRASLHDGSMLIGTERDELSEMKKDVLRPGPAKRMSSRRGSEHQSDAIRSSRALRDS